MNKANNPSQLWCQLIIDQLVKSGIEHFFCAPGMRNAPLLKAIAENPKAHAYTGFDERAQSYRALGFARNSQGPVALVCTSGTAVANFLPAVIEARKSRIPLIVLSGDRPGELNAIDANQTIDQTEVLRDYCKNYWMASEPQKDFPPRALSGRLNYLIHDTLTAPAGPLHLNIPLREPLDNTVVEMDETWEGEIKRLINSPVASIIHQTIEKRPHADALLDLFNDLKEAKKPLIIFGPMDRLGQEVLPIIEEFLGQYGGSFSCDVTSGLKYSFGAKDGLIPALDHPEVLKEIIAAEPDLIIHFGHRLTSKHYYKMLGTMVSKDPSMKCIQICEGHQHEDPGLGFQIRWNINPTLALKAIVNELRLNADKLVKRSPLFDLSALITKKEAIIEKGKLCYPVLTKKALENLEGVSQIFMGNSTFIRSFDSYAATNSPDRPWNVIANRGASGIEGHIAMAQGIYETNLKPTVAFMGDVSFIHDLGSLAMLKQLKASSPLLITLANNKGGGIFKLLPIGKTGEDYLKLLTTNHEIEFSSVIKAFDFEVKRIENKESYEEALKEWSQNKRLLFLECLFTDEDNAETYDQLKTVKL